MKSEIVSWVVVFCLSVLASNIAYSKEHRMERSGGSKVSAVEAAMKVIERGEAHDIVRCVRSNGYGKEKKSNSLFVLLEVVERLDESGDEMLAKDIAQKALRHSRNGGGTATFGEKLAEARLLEYLERKEEAMRLYEECVKMKPHRTDLLGEIIDLQEEMK